MDSSFTLSFSDRRLEMYYENNVYSRTLTASITLRSLVELCKFFMHSRHWSLVRCRLTNTCSHCVFSCWWTIREGEAFKNPNKVGSEETLSLHSPDTEGYRLPRPHVCANHVSTLVSYTAHKCVFEQDERVGPMSKVRGRISSNWERNDSAKDRG